MSISCVALAQTNKVVSFCVVWSRRTSGSTWCQS